ncbi:phage terminase small subunit [Vibrio sp. HN007]|uniref:phage terminase small subunit n=1 Tax=Vibrio iocasae TaxID=3098914 RepID=UPI0035D4C6E5
MHSPLAKQRQQILDQQAKGEAVAVAPNTESLHLKLVEFENDKKALKNINSIAEKAKHKREVLIPKYQPSVEAYLEAGEVFENPIFTLMIIWLFDIGDMETAINWLTRAIELNIPTPAGFKREDWQTICADEVLTWSTEQSKKGQFVEPYFSQVKENIFGGWDINEAIKAQYLKFEALELLMNDKREPQPTAIGDVDALKKSIELMEQAEALHSKAGVGTMRKKAEQRVRALETGKNL